MDMLRDLCILEGIQRTTGEKTTIRAMPPQALALQPNLGLLQLWGEGLVRHVLVEFAGTGHVSEVGHCPTR